MLGIDFERLFERLPSPYMVLDRELRYVAANAAYEQATLRSKAELIGQKLFDLFPNEGESGRRLRASFERVFETGEADTLAYIPYDIPVPSEQGGGFEERYWTAVHTPLTDDEGKVVHVVQNTVDVTDIVRLRQAASLPFRVLAGETQLIERAREAEDAHRALLAESEDFRRMFQQAPGFIAVMSGPEHVFTFTNDSYRKLIGERDVIGLTVKQALPEIAGQGFFEMLDSVYRTGDPVGGEGVRVMIQQKLEGEPTESFIDFSYKAIKDAEGRISGVFVQGMDRTEAVCTLRRQRLLLDELNHRVKNTLATVQSIASQTLRSARDINSARKNFEARIIALSKAHNLLSARHWGSTDLKAIVDQELSVYGRERIATDGPSVMLNPKASIAVAMLLHELSTNAARYGSLSVRGGRVSTTWSVRGDNGNEMLSLSWSEMGGPPVSRPDHQGFGSRMIERVATGELGGRFSADYPPEGFRFSLDIPVSAYGRKEDDAFAV